MTRRDGRRHHLAGLALLGALALLPACGIPLDAKPHTIKGLANNPPTPTSTGPQRATIFYMQDDASGNHLKGVQPRVASLSPATLLTLVVQEPTVGEAAEKIFNALNPNDALGLGDPNATSGVLTVVLPNELHGLEGNLLADAYGEIVYTLLNPVNNHGCAYTGVRFLLDGQPWPALLPNFLLAANRPVAEEDYAKIAPVISPGAPGATC